MKIFNFTLFLIATFSFSLLFAPVIVRAEDGVEDEAEEDAVINEEAENPSAAEVNKKNSFKKNLFYLKNKKE